MRIARCREILLVELVEAGCWAPTAGNLQTWRFVIVTEMAGLRALRMVAPGMQGDPPAAIVVGQDLEEATQRVGRVAAESVMRVDAAMAAFSITLQAYALGLGTCIVGSFHAAAVRELLRLPQSIVPVLIVSVGYAAQCPPPPARTVEGRYFFEAYHE